jgi:acyl carrier protein
LRHDEISTRIARVLSDRLARDVPAADADLFEAGVLDSLGFAGLLVGLEDEFGIHFAVDVIDFERFRTLARLCDVVHESLDPSSRVERAA